MPGPIEVGASQKRAADFAAVAVVALAGALSAAWAFIVPIFQASDEAAHFDYAISIFSAGRLVETRGQTAAWIVSPYTRYLLRATDYFEVAFHSSVRPPKGYGSLAFYRRLDANAPNLSDPPPASSSVSYIAGTYPFGFYALEALWMKAVAVASGSLVAMFFGARLLCVFLTMLGLYFSYRAALNVGVPAWLGVVMVASVGFFPLTTLVSSYVQPDNLAFTLVAASLFFATRLRATRRPFAATAALGMSLGLLAVTKYHFFLSAAIPIGLLVVVRLRAERLSLAAAVTRLLALGIPTIALLSVQFALVSTHYAPPRSAPQPTGLLSPFFDALNSGIAPALTFLFANAVKAFLDFFVSGPNAASYWGVLGLSDAPIVIVNPAVEFALRIFISAASVTVAIAIAYRVLRNAGRLATIAARGRALRAALLATNDPILGSYVLFTALMFALYAVSDDAFGAVGRHWYPYVFIAFLCAAWYAPRTFPRLRMRGPIIASAAIAAYAIVASGYATTAVIDRYYGPSNPALSTIRPTPAQIVPGHALGALWPVQGMDLHPQAASSKFRAVFALGSRLWAGGAAIFPNRHAAAKSVAVVVDDRLTARTVSRLYNFQIAEATRDLAYGYSGFFGAFGTDGLAEGAHVVRAFAKAPQSELYQEILPPRAFFLAPGSGFSGTFLDTLRTAPPIGGKLEPVTSCPRSVLLQAVVSGAANARRDSVPWFMVDSMPFGARYSPDERSFTGAIPSNALAPGTHTIAAFIAEPKYSRYWRIPGAEKLVIASRRPPLHLTWSAPPTASDCRLAQ